MKNYYEIFGVKKDATTKEINEMYNKYKSNGNLTVELDRIYNILNEYHSRRKYDDSLQHLNTLSFIKIPFFGYDFDEKYIKSYSTYEKKRYHIEKNKYLIYEKHYDNGKINKKYYVEDNGKVELLSDESIRKLKEVYFEKNSPSPNLLKETATNRVLPK